MNGSKILLAAAILVAVFIALRVTPGTKTVQPGQIRSAAADSLPSAPPIPQPRDASVNGNSSFQFQHATTPPTQPAAILVPPPKTPVNKLQPAVRAKADKLLNSLLSEKMLREGQRKQKIFENAYKSEADAREAVAELESCVKSNIAVSAPELSGVWAQAQAVTKQNCASMAQRLASKFPALQSDVNDKIMKHLSPGGAAR